MFELPTSRESAPTRRINHGLENKDRSVGAVAGRDALTREGQAQQHKAEAQRNAAKKEAEAEAAAATPR